MWLKVFFFVSYSGERSMPPSYTFTLRNLFQLCVRPSYCLHTSSLSRLNPACQSVCVRMCVRGSQHLALASSRSFAGAPVRTEGHWDNYKTMSCWKLPGPAVRRETPTTTTTSLLVLLFLSTSSSSLPLSLSPPPANWHRQVWCQQATPTLERLP